MDNEYVDTRSSKFVKAMATAKKFHLSRQDRLDLAEYLLRRDIASWTQLTEPQLDRILDALEGFELISQLIMSGAGQR